MVLTSAAAEQEVALKAAIAVVLNKPIDSKSVLLLFLVI
jgi:hypothetical protein